MLASAALGYLYTPEDLYKDFPDIDKYRDGYGGFGDGLFKDKEIMEKLNLKLENENGTAYYEGKAWNEGRLMDALEDGKRAIWCTQNKTFTDSGHYIELELKDGKIWLNDPNGANYQSMEPTLKNILENGCTPEEFKKYGGRFYIFDVANSEEAGKNYTGEKSNEVLMSEILEEAPQTPTTPRTTTTPTHPTTPTTPKNPTTSTTPTNPTNPTTTTNPTTPTRTRTTTSQSEDTEEATTINPKWDSDYLTAPKGYIKYEGKDGRLTKETWCDLDTTQLVINMHERRI